MSSSTDVTRPPYSKRILGSLESLSENLNELAEKASLQLAPICLPEKPQEVSNIKVPEEDELPPLFEEMDLYIKAIKSSIKHIHSTLRRCEI